jgi:hypothetical protein
MFRSVVRQIKVMVMCALALAGATVSAANASALTALGQDEIIHLIAGVLPNHDSVPNDRARGECLVLPGDLAETVLGPHGDTLLARQCRVVAYEALGLPRWTMARYGWTLEFTAEDRARGAGARDVTTVEEVVLFEATTDRAVRPVWHGRFDTSDYAVWRSVTPQVAATPGGTMVLSVMSCVNGTGGCGQDFLHRHADGRWTAVAQTWLGQLPAGFRGRLQHGVQIDPKTLHGEAGFYHDGDPNCCPSERLEVDLMMRGDALVLRGSPQLRKSE